MGQIFSWCKRAYVIISMLRAAVWTYSHSLSLSLHPKWYPLNAGPADKALFEMKGSFVRVTAAGLGPKAVHLCLHFKLTLSLAQFTRVADISIDWCDYNYKEGARRAILQVYLLKFKMTLNLGLTPIRFLYVENVYICLYYYLYFYIFIFVCIWKEERCSPQ